jgi:hypothetical protein
MKRPDVIVAQRGNRDNGVHGFCFVNRFLNLSEISHHVNR